MIESLKVNLIRPTAPPKYTQNARNSKKHGGDLLYQDQ